MIKKVKNQFIRRTSVVFLGLYLGLCLSANAQVSPQQPSLPGILPSPTAQSTTPANNTKGKPSQGFDVFQKDKQLEALVERYQKSAWAANAAKLTEKALVQEYVALEALQNYLTVQQQQKQQRIQALMSTYQALKTQEAFKSLEKENGAKK